MLKSPAKKSFKAFWRPPAVTVVCLMLLICIVALMVQKDVVTIETAKIALVLCCLIA